MLDVNPSLNSMYSVEGDNTEVLYITNAKATFYSFTSEPRVVYFYKNSLIKTIFFVLFEKF